MACVWACSCHSHFRATSCLMLHKLIILHAQVFLGDVLKLSCQFEGMHFIKVFLVLRRGASDSLRPHPGEAAPLAQLGYDHFKKDGLAFLGAVGTVEGARSLLSLHAPFFAKCLPVFHATLDFPALMAFSLAALMVARILSCFFVYSCSISPCSSTVRYE